MESGGSLAEICELPGPGRMRAKRDLGGREGLFGVPGDLRSPMAIVKRQNWSKRNEPCVVRGESETEGAQRLNGGQPHPPLPLQLKLGKTRAETATPFPFFLVSYSTFHPHSLLGGGDPGTWGESRDPGTGGAGAAGGLSQGRVLGCVGRGVCVCA